MKNDILVVAAHPDDEILGCGGTIARCIKQGYQTWTLILGEGVTSRDQQRNQPLRTKELHLLKASCLQANKILGVKKVILRDFPDNRFDTVPLIEIVKVIEEVKQQLKPGIIFTHYRNDLNEDHKITHQAVLTATRPLAGESVKEIYSFEVLSSTEWNYPQTFSPDIFYDISETLDYKLKALSRYKSELRMAPHPRSLYGVKVNAAYWGMRNGLKYAEAYEVVRVQK